MRPPRILPITPGSTTDPGLPGLLDDLRRLRSGGGEGVLIREPLLSDKASLELCLFARALFVDGWVGVNDRVHVGLASGVDAVHLGYKSLSPSSVQAIAAGQISVGHSHHAPELLMAEMVADYRFIGPVFPTPSKEGLVEPMGLSALNDLPMASRTWAVGGIGPEEALAVLSSGVAGLACIRSVFGVGDPEEGIARMLEAVACHA
jgi:thiamine-phosphate pyrophosphorylase